MSAIRSQLIAAAAALLVPFGPTIVDDGPRPSFDDPVNFSLSITASKTPNIWNVTASGVYESGYDEAFAAVGRGVYVNIYLHGVDGVLFKCHPSINYPVIRADHLFGMWPDNDGLHFSRTFPVSAAALNEDGNGADEIIASAYIHEPDKPSAGFGCAEITNGVWSNEVDGEFGLQPGDGPSTPPQQPPPPPAPPVAVPDVIGDTPTEAANELTASGLTIGTTTDVTDCNNFGTVISSTPHAGTQVKPGSAIALTFGRKPLPPQVCP